MSVAEIPKLEIKAELQSQHFFRKFHLCSKLCSSATSKGSIAAQHYTDHKTSLNNAVIYTLSSHPPPNQLRPTLSLRTLGSHPTRARRLRPYRCTPQITARRPGQNRRRAARTCKPTGMFRLGEGDGRAARGATGTAQDAGGVNIYPGVRCLRGRTRPGGLGGPGGPGVVVLNLAVGTSRRLLWDRREGKLLKTPRDDATCRGSLDALGRPEKPRDIMRRPPGTL